LPDKDRFDADLLPPLEDTFLAECFFACGPIESNGMGAVGISPQRLESWMRLTGYELNCWQAETILEMSRAYATIFGDEKARMPWRDKETELAFTKKMKAAFRAAR